MSIANEKLNQELKEIIELRKTVIYQQVLKHKRHFREPQKPITANVISIDDYVNRRKKFSLSDFNSDDIRQIESMHSGFIIIKNVKIPIKANSIDLTQWIEHKPKKAKTDKSKQKEQNKDRQKRYREKQKAIANGLIIDNIADYDKSLSIDTPLNIVDYRYRKTDKSNYGKRIITAKRLNNAQKPHMKGYKVYFLFNLLFPDNMVNIGLYNEIFTKTLDRKELYPRITDTSNDKGFIPVNRLEKARINRIKQYKNTIEHINNPLDD